MTSDWYSSTRQGLDDGICLMDYDPSWPQRYDDMARQLQYELGADVRIEHYDNIDSGVPAKPIIDILVEIDSFEEARKLSVPMFNRPG